MTPPRVSLVIPVLNEEAVLPELLRRVGAVLDRTPGGPHEVVIVDDGSGDRSAELVETAGRSDPRVVLVSLSRAFGHQRAITAGLDHASGEVMIVMDGDLQDQPEAIPRFLEQHARGYDVVYAKRVRRKEGLLLRCAYFLFYRLMAAFSSIVVPLDAGDFSLLSRRVVDALRSAPERQRYLRGLRAWVGFRQIGIEVERDARFAGEPKYRLFQLLGLAFDGIFAFSVVPLRAATLVGVVAMLSALAFAAYSVWKKLMGDTSPQGFTALIVALVFLSGVQLCFLGVIGEYVGRAYEESKGRPHYVVRRIVPARPPATDGAPAPVNAVRARPAPEGSPATPA